MPKYKIKNENVLYEFMDSFWKNTGKRKGNKFITNLFARLQGQDEPDYEKLAKDLEDL